MGRPGFWDDQEAAARTSAAHARAQRKLKTFRELESEVGDLDELAEMAAEDEEMAAELATQLASVERRLAELEEARLFSGEYDAGRRRRHRPRRRRRHRLPGLGRDPAADVPALGGAARLRGRDEGGLAGGGGGAQVGDLHRPRRERLRPLRRRARRPPAGADLPLRLLGAPPHQLRPGRRRPAGRRGGRGRDRRRRPARRHLPRLRRRRPARQQDRLGGADHPPPDRRRRPVPERALADPEQGGGDAAAALEADRAGGAQTRRGRWPRSAARSRTSPGARRSAATSCTPTSGSRTTAPGTRPATPSACSTATSTTSSATT